MGNAVIDQMKVVNLNRQRNYAERWEELISQATPIFNKLVEIAGKTPRNFILDQTNVYKNARRRKAAAFKDFGIRRCVTIVNDEDTLAQRTDKREREEGKFVPLEAVNQMRANFVAPETDDGFTELEWPELPEKDSRDAIWNIKSGGQNVMARNPGAMQGQVPKSRIENRDASTIGKGAYKGKVNDEKPKPWENRSSPYGGGGGGGAGGGKGGGFG